MAGIQMVSILVVITSGMAANIYPSQRRKCQSSGQPFFKYKDRRPRSSITAYSKRTTGEHILVLWYSKEYPKSRSPRQGSYRMPGDTAMDFSAKPKTPAVCVLACSSHTSSTQ